MKRLISVLILLILLLGFTPVAQAQSRFVLHVEGNRVLDSANKEWFAVGVNVEAYRDYVNGCGWATDGAFDLRKEFGDLFSAWGVNAVRMNYTAVHIQDATRFKRFMDFAQSFTDRGMIVMFSDHVITGKRMSAVPQANIDMFGKIWTEAQRRSGMAERTIFNPYNEPGPDDSPTQWKDGQFRVLKYLRETAKFTGIVVLDGSGWATMVDVPTFRLVQAEDARLLGGKPNVAFSNHLYPNITDVPSKAWAAAASVPMFIGELGQENPGASPLTPTYVTNVIKGFLSTGRNNGHAGLFAWIANWCDVNSLVENWEAGGSNAVPYKAPLVLTNHGKLWLRDFYSVVRTQPLPTLQASPTLTPTRASTNTPTPKPSNTPMPTSTGTLQPTVTVSACPDGQVEIKVSANGQTIIICGVLQ